MRHQQARWIDGVPANLPAAALDAQAWLVWLQQVLQRCPAFRDAQYDEARARLARCLDVLQQHTAPHGQEPQDAPHA